MLRVIQPTLYPSQKNIRKKKTAAERHKNDDTGKSNKNRRQIITERWYETGQISA